jgi:poly-gamma-glutamate capsule biosynthesis protein CapA/YwtB (metallophosphatase superfamily)
MPLTLAAAGDILMSSGLNTKALDCLASVHAVDVATGNLEFVLTDSKANADKFIGLDVSPVHTDDIVSLGFQVVSVANNHALDFGVDGLRETLANVAAAGMIPIGGGENLEESLRPAIVEAGGKRVAIFAASSTLPNSSAAGPYSPGIAPVRVINRYRIDGVTIDESPGMSPYVETEAVASDVIRLCDAIRDQADTVDQVVVHLHWGVPFGWVAATQDEIADYQRPLAHALIDAGATLIVGHHPHYIQGVEYYKDVPIFYSLGNFIKQKVRASVGREGIHPPYKMDSVRGYWNKIGCLALVEWHEAADRPRCKFLILQLDDAGEPHNAERKTAQALLDRIHAQCLNWGTEAIITEEDARVAIEFS